MFLSRCYRALKKYFAVIIMSITMGLLAYRLLVLSLRNAVGRYFNTMGEQDGTAHAITDQISRDMEGLLVVVVAGIILLVITLFLAGIYLSRLKNRAKMHQNTLKNAIEASNIITITLDPDGTIVHLNKHAQNLFRDAGIDTQGILFEWLPKKDVGKLKKRMVKTGAADFDLHFELRLKEAAGYRHLYCSIQPCEAGTGIECYELLAVDITDRARKEIELRASHEELTAVYEELAASEDELKTQLEELVQQKIQLQESEARYELVIDAAQIGIWDWDVVENQARYSDKWYEIFDFDKNGEPISTDTWRRYIIPEDEKKLIKVISEHIEKRTPYFEYEFRYKKEKLKWIHAVGKGLWDSDGRMIRMAGAYTDSSVKKETEEKINKLAYTDLLTGLPNKISLIERFTKEQRKKRAGMALILIDLDDFKLVNDSYGHLTGDKILIEVSERLKHIVTDNMYLARLGGDEFAILVWGYKSEDRLSSLANEIEERVDGFINLKDVNISLSTSIGITLFPQDALGFDELFKNAEMAMYRAKDKKSKYLFYHRELNDAVVERLNITNCLKGALEANEFTVSYQPQYDTRSQRIMGLEALLRWKSKRLGRVPPSRFIPVAEETRLIIPIGEYVLRSALAFLKKIREKGHDQLIMCINISIIQLMQKDFTDLVLGILKENKIPCHLIELEITESVLMESVTSVLENIIFLREAGVKIALDDFGTGYSSLNYLMHLPINTLKIDKSFIDNIGQVKENGLLVSTIMNIGRRLGLSIVAEGVEFKEQLDYLMRRKCDRVQGFLLSKPLPEQATEALLEEEIGIRAVTGH